MDFLPSLDVLLAYSAAALVLILTPGPDMTLFLGQTLTGGRVRGFAAYLGASAGLVVHTMLAAFGLSALLAHSATAFGVLKIAGVGINLLNPKIVMFFLTFLPQFVSASDPHAGAKLMFLGLYFIALAVPICFVLILAAERFTAAIR